MYALDQHKQAFFVGIRSTFYRFAMLTALGLIPVLAGTIQKNTGLEPVTFQTRSVPPEEYTPFDPSEIQIVKSEGEPALLLFPRDLKVPVYQEGKSEIDSAVVYIALSAPPENGETVVVNVVRKSGSKDLDLSKKQTGRFEFTGSNWNKPVAATVKVNHNLVRKCHFRISGHRGKYCIQLDDFSLCPRCYAAASGHLQPHNVTTAR